MSDKVSHRPLAGFVMTSLIDLSLSPASPEILVLIDYDLGHNGLTTLHGGLILAGVECALGACCVLVHHQNDDGVRAVIKRFGYRDFNVGVTAGLDTHKSNNFARLSPSALMGYEPSPRGGFNRLH